MSNIQTKGLTLIELLVVIAIIGILSSIVLSSINKARNGDSKTEQSCEQFANTPMHNAHLVPDSCVEFYQNQSDNK